MPLTSRTVPAQVTVRLSYPSRSDGQRRAELVIVDAASRLTLATVYLDPDQFFNVMRGLEDGQRLNAEVLDFHAYARVGRQRHTFSRIISAATDAAAQTWADEVKDLVGLHATQVSRTNRGTYRAVWVLWADDKTADELVEIHNQIHAADPPQNHV